MCDMRAVSPFDPTCNTLASSFQARMTLTTYLAVRSDRIPRAFGKSYCFLDHPAPSCPWTAVPDTVAPQPVLRSSVEWQTVGASLRLGRRWDYVGKDLRH